MPHTINIVRKIPTSIPQNIPRGLDFERWFCVHFQKGGLLWASLFLERRLGAISMSGNNYHLSPGQSPCPAIITILRYSRNPKISVSAFDLVVLTRRYFEKMPDLGANCPPVALQRRIQMRAKSDKALLLLYLIPNFVQIGTVVWDKRTILCPVPK